MIFNAGLRNSKSIVLEILRHSNFFRDGVKFCNLFTTAVHQRRRRREKNSMKIIKPEICEQFANPILSSLCNAAVIIGGASGFGFAAADYLLSRGARGIIIADVDAIQGNLAVQTLCESYGAERAKFLRCDIRNSCQFAAALHVALKMYRGIHVLFNDLDKEREPLGQSVCGKRKNNSNYTQKSIDVGVELMSKKNGGNGGIIVNCASILGFMGWPEDPTPVYCKKDPAVETTLDLAKKYDAKTTGVRLVALCPTNKEFSSIGLPILPDISPKDFCNRQPCMPPLSWKIGFALDHVMAWAESGTVWVVEKPSCVHEIPRLIHFPRKEGGKVDPKVYEAKACPPAIEAYCAPISTKQCLTTTDNECKAESTNLKKN